MRGMTLDLTKAAASSQPGLAGASGKRGSGAGTAQAAKDVAARQPCEGLRCGTVWHLRDIRDATGFA